ncbi:hypothetical protein AB0L00_38465 [Actinoallomurus sp. NPDC052308]|uniref:hypothetical protein n=1 Tax=Actinoallomurus sp. NPDC052308 TaxID=3155530 RepID=UPI00342FE17C
MTNPNPDRERRTPRRTVRATETSEYAAFVLRVLKSLGDRIADDPAMLAHIPAIQQAVTDNINRGIYTAKNKDWQPYSLAEMGRIMGCSYQAIQQRVERGQAAHVKLQVTTTSGAVIRIADVRAQRAAALAAANVNDVTGSARERNVLKATGTEDSRERR